MNKASIGIAGTPDLMSGFQPLIDIDYPLDLTEDPCFDVSPSEDFLIELKHTEAYVSLLYFARPDTVHSNGQARPARLSIGLTIPRGKRFSNGVSPYTVLMDVLETFRRLCMTPRDDGSYEFKHGPYRHAPFDDLLENKYPLEDYPGRYVEMRGETQVVVCPVNEDEMTHFFADTQYPEFAEFGSVLVSPDPLRTDAFIVEIPRPIYFDVFCSGTRYAVLTSPDQRFDRTLPPPDDFHYPVQVSFSLAELRKGECSSFANVDEAKEQIHLFPLFPDREFRLEFEFRPSSGTLSEIQCDPKRFYLVASGAQRKPLQWEEGKCFASFVGMEANEHWNLRFDGEMSDLLFKYVVTGLNPKEGGTAIVTLTPLAPFQGIIFSGARFLKEDAYLEVTFSNKDVFKRPVSRDGDTIKLAGRKEKDIEKVRVISDRYSYPDLNRSYDPVTGWISALLSSDPILRETSSVGTGSGKSRKLVIENRAVGFSASVCAVFLDGTDLNWGTKNFDRQESGKEDSLPIPDPFGTETRLDRVYLFHPTDSEGVEYKRIVFAYLPNPRKEERPLSTLDSYGNYKIVIDSVATPTLWEKVVGWLKARKVRRWWFIGLLALLAGCLIWQYLQPKVEVIREAEPQPMVKSDLRRIETKVDKEEEKDDEIEVVEEGSISRTYVLPAEDAAKLEHYVYLMKNLQNESGEPLTFAKVKEIQNWQIGISNAAGNKNLGPNFNFIKQYIGQFVRAVDEINRIKNGAYRGKGWTVGDYSSNCKELLKVSYNCPGDDLKLFRIVIQNLAIMGQDDLANERKCSFIRRAILSSAPRDVSFLADVNSFKAITDKYNSQ